MSTFTIPGGQSGEAMHRRFCTKCGSPILIEKDGTGRKLIMAGTLDDKSQLKTNDQLVLRAAHWRGERIRATKRAQKARGEYLGGVPPFGYDAERKLVPIPEQHAPRQG